jgi:hypothetical protein
MLILGEATPIALGMRRESSSIANVRGASIANEGDGPGLPNE